jgi:ribonucleotide monophosphatase NagD (HAD superfamily)
MKKFKILLMMISKIQLKKLKKNFKKLLFLTNNPSKFNNQAQKY